MPSYFLAFITALIAVYALTPLVIKFAVKAGAMDKPDPRKVHKKPIPRLGGLAIYFAFMIAVCSMVEFSNEIIGLLLGGTFIVVVGIIDDFISLPAKVKLLGQILAACILVAFDIRIDFITDPFGDFIFLEYLAVPVTIFWVVGITNTVNLIDGLDGLAAGVSTIATITILLVALQSGDLPVVFLTAALAGASLGFLHYNFNPARIFMGDTGSMFLGYMFAAISIIGAVSPQGSDFSEPVTQNTKRFVRTFWALDKALAYARHYFAINWNQSYSEYIPDLERWFNKNVDPKFLRDRQELSSILAEETKLMEIVKLMGSDVLPDDQKLVIEVAKLVRVGYLQQNAFHPDDTYVPLEKQLKMMEVILYLYKRGKEVVSAGKPIRLILETGIFDRVVKMKYDVPNNNLALFDDYYKEIDEAVASID